MSKDILVFAKLNQLQQVIEKSNRLTTIQNWIMIVLTIAILYLSYLMAFNK